MNTMKENYYHVGLTDEEVRQSRAEHGVNLLTPPKRPSMWKLYLEKFQDPVVKVLLVAAFFSLVISIVENEYAETIGIIAAILLATGTSASSPPSCWPRASDSSLNTTPTRSSTC